MYNRFTWTSLLGYGWDAIIITTLAKKNPIYVPFAAFFLALSTYGSIYNVTFNRCSYRDSYNNSRRTILLVVAEQFLSKYKHKMISKEAKATLSER